MKPPKIKWHLEYQNFNTRIGVMAELEDGRRHAVTMPRESFDRHVAKQAILDFMKDRV